VNREGDLVSRPADDTSAPLDVAPSPGFLDPVASRSTQIGTRAGTWRTVQAGRAFTVHGRDVPSPEMGFDLR
jgi:hypothetical protein